MFSSSVHGFYCSQKQEFFLTKQDETFHVVFSLSRITGCCEKNIFHFVRWVMCTPPPSFKGCTREIKIVFDHIIAVLLLNIFAFGKTRC